MKVEGTWERREERYRRGAKRSTRMHEEHVEVLLCHLRRTLAGMLSHRLQLCIQYVASWMPAADASARMR
jgi:hypothetical protein